MTKNLMIYPFGRETSPIARHNRMKDYSLKHLVAFKGAVSANQDANIFDGGDKTGFIIGEDFDKCIAECDVILFSFEPSGYENIHYIEQIQKAINANKEVLITKTLQKELNKDENGLKETLASLLDKITVLGQDDKPSENNFQKLLPINVPVIMVMGIGDYCNKFDIHLSLCEYYEKLGYKVSQLGSKDYSSLFGFNPIPDFIFEDMSFSKKVFALNNYVYKQIKKEQPEIFIMSVPGGIMPIDDENPNYFGEIPYIVTNAIKPDITVCSVYHNYYLKKFFEDTANLCKFRLRSEADFFNMSNTRIIIEHGQALSYMTLSSEYVLNTINDDMKDDAYTLFNALNNQNMVEICEKITNQLAENIAVV